MKALNNPSRKNQILFGFLVLTLAMSKSWFATAEGGRMDYASETVASGKVVGDSILDKDGNKIATFREETREDESNTVIKDGVRTQVTTKAKKQTVAILTVECTDCPGGNFSETHPYAEGSDPNRALLEWAATLKLASVKKAKEAKKIEEQKKKCELVEVDGELKKTSRDTFKNIEVTKAYVNCLADNDLLTLAKVRGSLAASIRRSLVNKDEDKQEEGRELRDMIYDLGDDKVASYMEEMEDYDDALSKLRQASEDGNAAAIDNIAGCMNPTTYQRGGASGMLTDPKAYYCQFMGFDRPSSSGEYQSMVDGYATIKATACSYMSAQLGSAMGTSNGCSNVAMNFGDGINGRPVSGSNDDLLSQPLFTDGALSSSRLFRSSNGTGTGLNSGIPQVGSQVYGFENRYDQNALSANGGSTRQFGAAAGNGTTTGGTINNPFAKSRMN